MERERWAGAPDSSRLIFIVTWTIVVGAVAARFGVAAWLIGQLHAHNQNSGDIDAFRSIARAHGRPYVDYPVAYPPLTWALLKACGAIGRDRQSFGASIILINLACDLGIAAVLRGTWGRASAAIYLVASFPMLVLLDTRLDTVSTLVAVAAVALWWRGRHVVGGTLIAVATLIKLWPASLALIGWRRVRDLRTDRFTIAAAVAGLVLGGAWLALGGIEGVRQVMTYRGAKGWEVGTIPGLTLVARNARDIVVDGGAFRIGDVGPLHGVLGVGSIALGVWGIVRGSRVHLVGAGWVVAVMALLVFSPLLSPQFVLWALPGAAIAWSEGTRRLTILVASCAMLTGIVMARFGWILSGRPAWLAVLATRNALLVTSLIAGIIVIRRAETSLPLPETHPAPVAELVG